MLVIYVMTLADDLDKVTGFDWDAGNARKNDMHSVSAAEAEQVFFNAPLLLLEDAGRSQQERRLHALGRTDSERGLHISFTLRQLNILIRVISARDLHRKERAVDDQVS